MNKTTHFLSCDWGTTNFRIRLVHRETLAIIKEHTSYEGIKVLNDQAKNSGITPSAFFSSFLLRQVAKAFGELATVPIICSGMLSSNLGMKELPYSRLPLRAKGDNLITETIVLPNDQNLILVSGVRSEFGFMRGEETQALGLLHQMDKDGVLILPGTHSKHLIYEQGAFIEMRNFMTGELFSLVSSQSVLANSVQKAPWSDDFKDPFLEGVKEGNHKGLGSTLLTVRAKQMFGNQPKDEGYYYLSGLVIGEEISSLGNFEKHIHLAADDSVFELYRLALETIIDEDQLTLFNCQMLNRALFLGQQTILNKHDL
ncbi:MAG: 2-dehydro-3-deoxygalactonokinase [Cyclobacteriaceae bacterium]